MWSQLKSHFYEAYKAYLITVEGTSAQHGYTNNATEDNDNDILDTICNGFSALSMANNSTSHCNNNRMAEFRAAITDIQQ